ncbi:uncharacterized protein Dmoj_GI25954, isoform B [Drosophila mojavensis]|uniref:Uncharacterized protein, isoform B n=1 Tax=Drosophila mojavensis TaxID=7230 RepID=A0A0Q9X9F7_DROMO|nr:uncharacterized protein Dmoj_GI25954, isoform B [Drosophila mojavensis]
MKKKTASETKQIKSNEINSRNFDIFMTCQIVLLTLFMNPTNTIEQTPREPLPSPVEPKKIVKIDTLGIQEAHLYGPACCMDGSGIDLEN